MKKTYSWIIYSCIIFGTGILCDRKLERRQAVSSCSVNTDDKFHCSNGPCIEWPLVCDGDKDCSDGSDETKELCAIYEFGTNMTMDCGIINMKNQVVSEEFNPPFMKLPPWEVNVLEIGGKYIICCTNAGSMIAPNIVIAAADFFWNLGITSKETPITNDRFKVGSTEMAVAEYYLFMDVKMIYLPGDHNSSTSDEFKNVNIAVLVLSNKVMHRRYGYAPPICIDWFSKHDLRKEAQYNLLTVGKIGAVHITIQGLLPYKQNSSSKQIVNYVSKNNVIYDKIFITLNKEQGINGGVPGTGLGVLSSTTYFLTGVFDSYTLTNNNLVENIVFTGIKKYIPWIRGILNKHVTVSSCVLPTVEGVIYSYEGSNEILSHGTLVNRYATVIENCDVGYHKAYSYGFRVCQGKGKWSSNSDKLCFKMCPPLESDSLDIKCSYNGKYANCSNLSIPDTIAIPSCKPTYFTPNGQDEDPLELVCQPNGIWNKKLYRCNPYCGKVHIINNGIINDGKIALKGTAPWNAGVYRFNTKTSNYDLICGGSIISSNLVVSAAHCFWQKGIISKNISINDGLYKISIGKYDRNFTIIDNEFSKIMNVEIVYLNENYYGSSGFHADDIAIIVLRNRTSFSNGVSPVCIDWKGIYTIANGAEGKIVGWGKTEKGIDSPILMEASLPYIDHSTCRNMYTNGFESFVTTDKFCAGSALGQGVHEGDSGAGLSFLHSNSYHLTGIASIKDQNTNDSIAVFTDVRYHVQWIRRLYNKYN